MCFNGEILLECSDGDIFLITHDYDIEDEVSLDAILGLVSRILLKPIVSATEHKQRINYETGRDAYYHYKFHTKDTSLEIHWSGRTDYDDSLSIIFSKFNYQMTPKQVLFEELVTWLDYATAETEHTSMFITLMSDFNLDETVALSIVNRDETAITATRRRLLYDYN